MKIQKNLQISTQRIHMATGIPKKKCLQEHLLVTSKTSSLLWNITDGYLCGHADTCVAYDDEHEYYSSISAGGGKKTH